MDLRAMFVVAVTLKYCGTFFLPFVFEYRSSRVFAFNEFFRYVSNATITVEHPCVLLSIHEQTASAKSFPVFIFGDFSKWCSMQKPSIATQSTVDSFVELNLPAASLRGTRSFDLQR